MLIICEPLYFEECLVVGVITRAWNRKVLSLSVALSTIDRVTDVRGCECEIYDFNRCSYGPRQRVRDSGTRWRSRWNEPLNVNVKNTGIESFFVDPLRACESVPGKHVALGSTHSRQVFTRLVSGFALQSGQPLPIFQPLGEYMIWSVSASSTVTLFASTCVSVRKKTSATEKKGG